MAVISSGPGTSRAGHAHFDAVSTTQSTLPGKAFRYLTAALRISLGWIFLWAFLDKTFGLGHETKASAAWLDGGEPTRGFLQFAAKGPFADLYKGIAGDTWADWLFMIGLLGIGVALIAGVAMRIAAVSGALMLVLMWTAVLPPENNLFMDDHLIYAMLLGVLALVQAGHTLGLGATWEKLPIVARNSFLQ